MARAKKLEDMTDRERRDHRAMEEALSRRREAENRQKLRAERRKQANSVDIGSVVGQAVSAALAANAPARIEPVAKTEAKPAKSDPVAKTDPAAKTGTAPAKSDPAAKMPPAPAKTDQSAA